MEFKSTKPHGALAVLTDSTNRKSEVIDVDTMRLMAIVVNHVSQSLILSYVWGGYDSNGKFHIDPQVPASSRSIQANVRCNGCPDDPEDADHQKECEYVIWHQCTKDSSGNPVMNFDETFQSKILIDNGKLKDLVNGWNFKQDVELTHNGKSVLTKKQKEQSKMVDKKV